MTKEQILAAIARIITEATVNNGYIIADDIYRILQNQVNPGRTQETIRKYIRELVNQHDNLIGSSNKGYFKINSVDRANEAINYLLNRIPDLQERADNLRTQWNIQNPNNRI